MERNILLKIVLVIGIGLIVAGPILGIATSKINIANLKPALAIPEISDDELQSAFARPFTLTKNQKVAIKFSVFYPNVTARLKIFNKHYYDAEYALNSDPTTLIGENFIYSVHVLGTTPSLSTGTSVSITEQGEVYIEFAGDRSGFNLISLPGRYVVVVYGVNSGPDENVTFNIVINIDGPGAFLGGLFLTIGIIVLICYALLLSYNYLNKLRRGR
ncbi:MAG: hypothetical protein ACFE85_17940 [Candidatus Hodarchaeota archaeon]